MTRDSHNNSDVGLVGAVPATVVAALTQEGLHPITLQRDDLEMHEPDSDLPACVLVAEPLEEALKTAQLVNQLDASRPVFVFTDDPTSARRQLVLTPFLGRAVSAVGPADTAHIPDLVKEAIESSRKRRGYSQTLSEMRKALEGQEPAASVPPSFLSPLLDLAPIGIVLTDRRGNVLVANPYAETLSEELATPGISLASVFSNEDLAIATLLRATGSPVGPLVLEVDDGTGRRFIEATASSVDDGGAQRVLILLDDVTARIQAEARIKETRDSLIFQKSLLESQSEALADGVLVVGTDGKMIFFNSKFVEMWGIPPSVVESRSDEAAIRSVLDNVADPEAFHERITYLYEHPRESSRDELQLVDGRIIERFSAPVKGENDELFGRMWFFRDVTHIKRREQRLAFLAAATETASATRDLTSNLRGIASLAVQSMADICLIYLVGDDGVIDRVELADRDSQRQAYLREAVQPFEIDPNKPAGVGKVLQDAVPILATHADAEMMAVDVTDPQGLLEVIGPLGIESWICVPLRAHREAFGAISLVSLDASRRFTEDDLELALELSRRVSVGIETVRIAERERRIAETLQRSLLPQSLPDVPGLVVSSHYAAGSKGMDVGGDWFELVKLPGKKVLAVIGDVAGKGLRAAAVMGEIRMALRAYSIETSSPSDMVNRLNRLLADSEDFRMATLICAVIDLRHHQLCFVSAGHPPPLLLGPSGDAEFLDGGLHPPLGIPLHLQDEAEHRLPPGSTLLLYTDGVVERRDRAIDEGMDAMKRIVESTGSDPASLCASVVAAAIEGQDFSDDVAVLAIHIAPSGPDGLLLDATANPRELARVRDSIERWLITAGALDHVLDDVVLAANEACANAIEHAYGPGEGVFRVAGWIEEGMVVIEVADQGRWRESTDSDRGRGSGLIRALMDDVKVDASSSGTIVRMRKRLHASPEERTVDEPDVAMQRRDPSLVRVALSGELDLGRSRILTSELLGQVSNDSDGLILDLSDVTYIDSSGLRMLFMLQDSLGQRRQELTVVVPPASPLRRMLELGDIYSAVNIVPAVPD